MWRSLLFYIFQTVNGRKRREYINTLIQEGLAFGVATAYIMNATPTGDDPVSTGSLYAIFGAVAGRICITTMTQFTQPCDNTKLLKLPFIDPNLRRGTFLASLTAGVALTTYMLPNVVSPESLLRVSQFLENTSLITAGLTYGIMRQNLRYSLFLSKTRARHNLDYSAE